MIQPIPHPLAFGASVASLARGWVGTPYVDQQATKGQGCNCVGLLRGVAEEAGLTVAVKDTIAGEPPAGEFLRALSEYLVRYSVAGGDPLRLTRDQVHLFDPLPGDVAAFWIGAETNPVHAGIVVEGGFVHARHRHAGPSLVKEQGWSAFWELHTHSLWRWAG